MLWKCCTEYVAANLKKLQQWPQDWKRSVFTSIQKNSSAKECPNCHTIALISHASKMKLKILQVGLQEYTTGEHPEVQAGFRKGRETRDQTTNICWIQKTSISASLTKLTTLTVWITTKDCGKFLKRWEHQTTLPASWEACMQVKKQHLKRNMEQLTCPELGKKYDKAVYSHPAYLTYMQSTSCEILIWMNHNLKSRIPGEISQPQIGRWYHSNGIKWRGTKQPIDEGERGESKSWLKTQHSKN